MKLAMVTTYATPRNVRRELLELVASRGHEVVVVSPEPPTVMAPPLAEFGARYRQWNVSRIGLSPAETMRSAAHLFSILRDERPDVVLVYQIKAAVLAPIVAKVARVPRVVILVNGLGHLFDDHGFGATWKARVARGVYALSLRAADELVFHNPDLAGELRDLRLLPEHVPSRVVLGTGVDLEKLTARPPHLDPPTFTMVSRLLISKGVYELVEAARIVRGRYPDARFRLVGGLEEEGHPDGVPRRHVDEWVASGLVEYAGYVDDIATTLASTSVFVLPSYREGMPRTNLEALAVARPVITTTAVGCRETVVEGVNGFAVGIKDHLALSRAIMRYLDTPELIALHGQASRQLAQQKFDIRHINELMYDALAMSS